MGPQVVLYIEDDNAAFALVRIILAEENPPLCLYRACDGEQALAFVRRLAPYEDAPVPDLILLDWNLPKRNGLEVLTERKAAEPLRSIPVVLFSTFSSLPNRRAALALGAREYLAKPSDFEAFAAVVKLACCLAEESAGTGPQESGTPSGELAPNNPSGARVDERLTSFYGPPEGPVPVSTSLS
jgi:CheY-like chemotaxis protein